VLLDDQIDDVSFVSLKTPTGAPLLTPDVAEFLDGQMDLAGTAAGRRGHAFSDVILCCKAPDIDSGSIADELIIRLASGQVPR
jgi:hypothetical protein